MATENRLAVGIGVGPFLAGNQTKTFRNLHQCKYIGVRDTFSSKWCTNHGLSQTRLRADVCYLTDLWSQHLLKADQNNKKIKIGVIPRDWPHTTGGFQYFLPLIQVTNELRENGIEVQYFVFSKLREVKTMNLLEMNNENFITWDPKTLVDIQIFLQRISECDLIISARYHGIIAAACLGIPAIAIEIEPKLALASQTLAPGCVLWNQPFKIERLKELIEEVLNKRREKSVSILTEANNQARLVELMINEISPYF